MMTKRRTTRLAVAVALLVALTSGVAIAATVACERGDDRCVGTDERDQITGTNGSDEIFARGGRDLVDARGGDDSISGGEGSDGDPDAGRAGLFGDSPVPGTDTARDGDDEVRGGRGDDELSGFGGDDELSGDGGADFIDAVESGLFSGRGGTENPGEDTVEGGGGDDTIAAADRHEDTIDCGGGANDTVLFDEDLDEVENCENENPPV